VCPGPQEMDNHREAEVRGPVVYPMPRSITASVMTEAADEEEVEPSQGLAVAGTAPTSWEAGVIPAVSVGRWVKGEGARPAVHAVATTREAVGVGPCAIQGPTTVNPELVLAARLVLPREPVAGRIRCAMGLENACNVPRPASAERRAAPEPMIALPVPRPVTRKTPRLGQTVVGGWSAMARVFAFLVRPMDSAGPFAIQEFSTAARELRIVKIKR
jgi:hypothetical protein